jgi:hypothetical protein
MDEDTEKSITSPPDPTHEATTPPDNPPADDEAVQRSEDALEQPGGGH